jgi:hypothetical protein
MPPQFDPESPLAAWAFGPEEGWGAQMSNAGSRALLPQNVSTMLTHRGPIQVEMSADKP